MVKKELSSARAAPNPGIGSFRIILLMEASLKSYFRLLTWLLKSVGREIMYVILVYLNESITKHGLTPISTSHQSYPLVHPLHLSFWVYDNTMSKNTNWLRLYFFSSSLVQLIHLNLNITHRVILNLSSSPLNQSVHQSHSDLTFHHLLWYNLLHIWV